MLLLELISTLNWEWGRTPQGPVASFEIPTESGVHRYFVIFSQRDLQSYDPAWEILFGLEGANDPYELTGAGHSRKVFAAVLAIVDEFVEREDPAAIKFSAEEPERYKLYSRILGKYAKKGWEIEETETQFGKRWYKAYNPKDYP